MSSQRAWRFVHPDFDSGEQAGFQVSNTGGIVMVRGDAVLRQSLLLLLTTRPGERLMRPEYGCELYRIQFMPNDATTHGLAIHYIQRAIRRWEPRIEILQLDANADPQQPGHMLITLHYQSTGTLRKGLLEYTLSLQ